MGVLATGQISIIDYNDAVSLTSFISSNKQRTQIYSPDNGSFVPDWTASNLILTASLYKTGSGSDMISDPQVTSIKWYEATAPTTVLTNSTNYTVSGKTLTVKTNMLTSLSAIDYIVEITYRDVTTNLDLTSKASISFSKVTSGGGISDAMAWTPQGNVFKNGNIVSLTAQCDLWRGSIIDNTLITYQWFQQDSSQSTDVGGGIGWRKLTETANKTTGVTTNILTVYPSAILNIGVFKCIIKDVDSTSGTYNTNFMDTVTFVDQSDPLQLVVESSGGDIFKNGVGTSTLKARVFQAGTEVDAAGTKYTYKWYKFDKDGNLAPNFGGTNIAFKTGKTISVGDPDVDIKATFKCDVEG